MKGTHCNFAAGESRLMSTEKAQITYEILAHLAENTDAQDTIEGIIEWWLLEQKIKNSATSVKKALAELVAQGLVHEDKGSDSRPRYRINREKYGEIRGLLEQQKGRASSCGVNFQD